MPIFTQNEVNLHTHSFYCGHGTGEISDYVHAAVDGKRLKVLGFSEHCQTPDNYYPDRMRFETFETYMETVKSFCSGGEENEGLRVLLGAECDWNSHYVPYYSYLKQRLGFSYLIGSVHYCQDRETGRLLYLGKILEIGPYLGSYVKDYTDMLSSGLFLFGCHPDLFCYHTEWNKDLEMAASEIIDCARQYNMVLEVNGQGCLKKHVKSDGSTRYPYPVPEFWAMVREAGVRVCVNSDAHNPIHLNSPLAYSFAVENNLESLLVKWNVSEDGISIAH